MARGYHSVPLDDESLEGGDEKLSMVPWIEPDLVPNAWENLARHWVWLAHAVLLSVSMTLFTLSFMRDAKLSDVSYTKKYSSYCMLLSRRPPAREADAVPAPVAPIVTYDTVRYNLTPVVEGPYVGYGPEVDLAWDRIANNSE